MLAFRRRELATAEGARVALSAFIESQHRQRQVKIEELRVAVHKKNTSSMTVRQPSHEGQDSDLPTAPGVLLNAQRKFSGSPTGSEPAKPPFCPLL